MNFAPGKNLEAGTVGYFPEGTFYGPQADTTKSVVLLLQMGGAGGYGFMSYQQLYNGYERMCDLGNFDRGVFTRTIGDGKAVRKDGYEAIWEYINGREVEYPQPRYQEPIVINPESFSWMPTRDAGYELKLLGSFGERGLTIGQIRGKRGARHLVDDHPAPELLFVRSGAVRDVVTGDVVNAGSMFRIDPADAGREFIVVEDVELFFVLMHKFETSSPSSSAG
jgi:hypothetical protein